MVSGNGCVVAMGVGLAALFLFSSIKTAFQGGGQTSPQDIAQNGNPVAKIGSITITDKMITDGYGSVIQRNQISGPIGADDQVKAYGQVLIGLIHPALSLLELQKRSIQINDQDVIGAIQSDFDLKVLQNKMQLIQMKQLPPNATDAQYSNVVKKITGKSLEDSRADELSAAKAALANKSQRPLIIAQFADSLIPSLLAKQMPATDDNVKAAFTTLSVKRILLSGADAEKDASSVEQEVAKGTAFETLINRYSKDIPAKGQLLSSAILSITKDQLAAPPMSDLLKLSVGSVSAPIHLPEGIAIYKVLAVHNQLPADFEKNKAKYLADYKSTTASAEYASDMKQLNSGDSISWTSPGWQVLYELIKLENDAQSGKLISPDDWKSIADRAKSIQSNSTDAVSVNPAALAWYAAAKSEYLAAKPDVQKTLLQDRIDSIRAVAFADSSQLELDLADLLAQQKDSAGVTGALAKAISSNVSFDEIGIHYYSAVNAKEMQYKASGLLVPEEIKTIDAALAEWKKNKGEVDQEKAASANAQKQAAAQEAADRAKSEAVQKQIQAAQKKGPQVPTDRKSLEKSKSSNANLPSVTTSGSTAPPASHP